MQDEDKVEALERIEQENDKRKLLALSYFCEGSMRADTMTPEHYSECMVALSKKLGFGITDEALQKAAAEFLENSA